MRNDKINFGMEKNEPMCRNKVPREGIVIRKNDDEISEAFKLKCQKFLKREAEMIDEVEKGKEIMTDQEMVEAYT